MESLHEACAYQESKLQVHIAPNQKLFTRKAYVSGVGEFCFNSWCKIYSGANYAKKGKFNNLDYNFLISLKSFSG